MSATSGSLDSKSVAGAKLAGGLRPELLPVQEVPATGAGPAALRAWRGMAAALGDERVAHPLERLDLADHALPATPTAGSA